MGLQHGCGMVQWNPEQMVIVMEYTVYWGCVSSGFPCSDKGTAKAPQLTVWGHLFFLFLESCTHGESSLL